VPLEERPEGRKLMSVVEKGDVVITAKLDRMFRSALDALWIYRWGRSAGYARVRGLALVLYREDDTMSAIGQVDKDGIEWASGSDVRSRARRLIPYERLCFGRAC
jgi:DNA invertase Pin-like site-specific DNA recombinase